MTLPEQNRRTVTLRCGPLLMSTLMLLTINLLPGIAFSSSENTPAELPRLVGSAMNESKATQDRRDKWSREKAELDEKYETLLSEKNALAKESRRLAKRIEKRNKEIDDLNRQITEADRLKASLDDVLRAAVTELSTLVETGLPFELEQREKRIATLNEKIDDPELSPGEKFRRTAEVLQIESDYGALAETCTGTISLNGNPVRVDILRLGTVALFFRTRDRNIAGIYNPADAAWEPLPKSDRAAIDLAIDMAARQRSIDLVTLPIGRIRTK